MGCAGDERTEPAASPAAETGGPKPNIVRYRRLGRTGFQVSDLSIGGAANDAKVYRYAYDRGMNYFDTAESYGNGDAERKLGQALQHMDRGKVWITTKLHIEADETEASLLDRFGECQERLKTEYVDALYMHSVTDVGLLGHEGFHRAVARLKADGRLRHAGVSSHGPRGEGDSMEKVLGAAAEDGRFDLMLLVYNFMNSEEGQRVLAACRANDVGTTAMKTRPGVLEVEPFDPEQPSKEYADHIERQQKRGRTLEEAHARIREWVQRQEEAREKTAPFLEEHGVTTEEELHRLSVQWVLADDDMHTVCLGLRDFDAVDRFVPLSGSSLTRADRDVLDTYRRAFNSHHCRHNCTACVASCPDRVPVSTIMRYAYYFAHQGREKHAMGKYAGMAGRDAAACAGCDAPCTGACPHGLSVQANLMRAHRLLTPA